ncbi:hypothetical protein AKJ16_DCAP26769 [Drosera capensis]
MRTMDIRENWLNVPSGLRLGKFFGISFLKDRNWRRPGQRWNFDGILGIVVEKRNVFAQQIISQEAA